MRSLKDQFPRVLLGKHQLVMTVLFAAFFSLLFLLVSIPFSHNAWFNLGRSEAFWFTVVFFVFSLAIVSFSKVGLYMLRETANFTVLHYVLWNTVEILLIAVIYSFFTIEGDRFGIIDLHNMQFWRLFLSAVVYGVISLGVPYIIAALYFMLEEKDNTIRLMNYGNVVSDAPISPSEEKRITLFDNSGVLKFSINPDNLYFIESDDNYIQVWFLSSGREGYSLELESDATPRIPVSKTYEQAVLARFNSRA